MNTIGQKISESRKAKGLTQEELAELSKVNLRTIQRIENNENTPRGSTLNILSQVLQLELEELHKSNSSSLEKAWAPRIVHGIFLAVLNLAMMALFGYLTVDTAANVNSRLGGFLLSLFLPLFLVAKTLRMDPARRVLQYGTGFVIYIILAIVFLGIPRSFVSGLIPTLTLALTVLFYGNSLLKTASPER